MNSNRLDYKQRGFTLIEIMAVVFLIALIATGATAMFNRGGPLDDLYNDVEKFVLLAHRASDQSVLSGEPMGLVLTPPEWAEDAKETRWSYKWRRAVTLPDETGQLAPPVWQDIEGWEVIQLKEGVELFIERDGSEWEWQAVPASEEAIFVLYPSGEADPFLFEIEFAHQEPAIEPQHVELDETGRLQWKEAREARADLIERLR